MRTKAKRRKYEVLSAGEWVKCKAAELQPKGWLHYETHDGTTGIAQPKNWREVKNVNP